MMEKGANHTLLEDFAAALDWWRDAGVDCTFNDDPTNWIAAPVSEPAITEPVAAQADTAVPRHRPPLPVPAIDLSAMPDELAAFRAWWMAEPALDDGRLGRRVPPRGNAGAELMVVVPDPEREDSDRLLSGPQGRLLDAMLDAMGLGSDAVYFASALPRHTPMADLQEKASQGMGDVLRRHIALVRPKRLISFGSNILPLIDNDLAQRSAVLRKFNHEGVNLAMLAARSLPALLERPRWKDGLWRAWLDWPE